MGYANGVLDLRTREFRDGKPDDYITKTTGNNWKDFKDDKIFQVSFYSNENQSCQITDIQNIK